MISHRSGAEPDIIAAQTHMRMGGDLHTMKGVGLQFRTIML